MGWDRSGLLDNTLVTEIRASLPFGPMSIPEAEEYASRFNCHPLTILNIATGRSYKRVQACPQDHPLRLALNEEAARKQRIRHAAQKYRQAVGDAQGWKCKYCGKDVSGRGKSALDHIMPIEHGGLSERENLQLLCRRCNVRKRDHVPDTVLDNYMERKTLEDRIVDTLNEALPAIVDSLVWPDSTLAACIWCGGETVLNEEFDFPQPAVFYCPSCCRMFSPSGVEEKQELYADLHHAIYARRAYSSLFMPSAAEIIEALMGSDSVKACALIQERAGEVAEVKKRQHAHGRGQGCWCEYGGLEFEAVGVYNQDGGHVGKGGGPLYDFHL